MVIGQRNQSKGRWDKGTNQNGEKTKEPIKRTIGQRNQSKGRYNKGTTNSNHHTSVWTKEPLWRRFGLGGHSDIGLKNYSDRRLCKTNQTLVWTRGPLRQTQTIWQKNHSD